MAELQGIFSFPGMTGIRSASYTLSHGISPGVCRVEVTASAQIPQEVGTMRFRYGREQWSFSNCLVDSAHFAMGSNGQVVSLTILDRRWRWSFGSITGRYNNRRRTGGVTALDRYLKRPQELAKMLLEAMGETGFELSDLPDDTYPEVNWQDAVPAVALDALCSSLGCRVVLGINDRVKICRTGIGAKLPLSSVAEIGASIDPPNRPDSLEVVTSPTMYQIMLMLEAVGEDLDGTIKPINKLGYVPKPITGETTAELPWGVENPEAFDGVVEKYPDSEQKQRRAVELATKSVFRWYRVVTHCDGTLQIPGFGKLDSIKQLFPILDGLVDKQKGNATDGPERKPEYVQGIFEKNESSIRRYMIPTFANSESHETYQGAFSIDRERGLVMFSAPVYQRDSAGKIDEAELYLTCAVNVTEWKTNQRKRERVERNLPGPKRGTGPREIVHEDIVPTKILRYKPFQTTSFEDRFEIPGKFEEVEENDDQWKKEAKYYLDAAQAEYITEGAGDAFYVGWQKIAPDGAIQQITWSVDAAGTMTRASRNDETSPVVPPYAVRQRAGWVKTLLGLVTGGLPFREKDPRDG